MPYQATVFNVLIASPGDVQAERDAARAVIHEWNAAHSWARKALFQPIGWETHSHPSMEGRAQGVLNKQILESADLLVAIFWTRIGTPTGEAPGGSVEELERHIKVGKPAMVYFSAAPVRLDSVDEEQYRALKEYRARCETRGLVEAFDGEADFKQKFTRQLATKINQDTFFALSESGEETAAASRHSAPQLSEEAKALLLAASMDPHGMVVRLALINGTQINSNNKAFIERDNPRSRAAWDGALNELVGFGLLERAGRDGIHQITHSGYKVAELFAGQSPHPNSL